MKTKVVEPRRDSTAVVPIWRLPLEPPEVEKLHVRVWYAHAGRKMSLPPGQAVLVMPHSHMARHITVHSAGNSEAYTPAQTQDHENQMIVESIREDRRGTLARFVKYLSDNDVVGGPPGTVEERHAMQKYAYLANALGAPLHYEFNFLENGAYSPTLAIDLYAEASSGSGDPPFKENERAGELLVQMVRGRRKRELQAMTFAARDIQGGVGRDEFVEGMDRERALYDTRVLELAYDGVSEAISGARERDG